MSVPKWWWLSYYILELLNSSVTNIFYNIYCPIRSRESKSDIFNILDSINKSSNNNEFSSDRNRKQNLSHVKNNTISCLNFFYSLIWTYITIFIFQKKVFSCKQHTSCLCFKKSNNGEKKNIYDEKIKWQNNCYTYFLASFHCFIFITFLCFYIHDNVLLKYLNTFSASSYKCLLKAWLWKLIHLAFFIQL